MTQRSVRELGEEVVHPRPVRGRVHDVVIVVDEQGLDLAHEETEHRVDPVGPPPFDPIGDRGIVPLGELALVLQCERMQVDVAPRFAGLDQLLEHGASRRALVQIFHGTPESLARRLKKGFATHVRHGQALPELLLHLVVHGVRVRVRIQIRLLPTIVDDDELWGRIARLQTLDARENPRRRYGRVKRVPAAPPKVIQ